MKSRGRVLHFKFDTAWLKIGLRGIMPIGKLFLA